MNTATATTRPDLRDAIHPTVRVGHAHLRVADLDRADIHGCQQLESLAGSLTITR